MSRLNWNNRQSPTDFDNTAPVAPSLEFDYAHQGGAEPWPKGFGPGTIRKAWAGGLVVYAVIDGFPYPVAVREAQWTNHVLEVKTLDGPRIAQRIFTRKTTAGLASSGLLIEDEGDGR